MDELTADDPTWIGGYRLLGRLGAGGMGRVYLARSERGRTAAVKVVQAELAGRADFRKRFAQEVTAAQRVGGQWTAPVLDADTDAATPWVATGYVAGPSLAEVVGEQYGPLPVTSMRPLALGLVRALQAIHAAGLVHRDLKPSNVLVTIEGPRVIDFGIARALDAAVQSSGGLTGTGVMVGSPGFMSPEQVRGERVTPASDVFCLGAVLAYVVTGRLPFGTQDSGLHALLFRIAEEEPDLEGIPEPWQALVAGCLTKAPERRPTVDTLLADIEATDATAGADLGAAWLPAALLARLGQQAVQLLDSEDPQRFGPPDDPGPGTGPVPAAVPAPSPAPSPVPGSSTPAPGPGGPGGPAGPGSPSGPGGPGGSGHAPPSPAFGTAPQPQVPAQARAQAHAHAQAQPWQPATPMGPGVGMGAAGAGAPAAAPHSTPPPHLRTPGVRSARPLAKAVMVLLGLFALASGVHLFVLTGVSATLSEEDGGEELGDVENFDTMQFASMGAELAAGLSCVAVVVVWVCWFRRTRLNAEIIAPGTLRDTPGFAVGSWFIPFANLALPKRIANDIWKAAEPGHRVSRGLLQTWWVLWLCCLTALVAAEVSPSWYDDTLGPVRDAEPFLALGQTYTLVGIAAAVVAIFFVNRLTSLQEARLSNRGPLAAGS